jgi:hypothetical protein
MSEISLEDAFTDAEPEVVPETVVSEEVVAEAAEETVAETVEETPETPEPEVEPTSAKKDHWSITAVMDEREKRQTAVAENERLQKELAALQKPKEDISVFEDEAGWKAQQNAENQQILNDRLLNQSEALAVREYGNEKVQEAAEWFKTAAQQSPYLLQRFQTASLQYHEVVDMYAEEKLRSKMSNVDAYRAELKAELIAEIKSETGKAAESAENKLESIPQSLASQRSGSVSDAKDIDLSVGDILGR